jgi:hypothetical protein
MDIIDPFSEGCCLVVLHIGMEVYDGGWGSVLGYSFSYGGLGKAVLE